MGLSAGQTGSRGKSWAWAALLVLVLALVGAHLILDRNDAERSDDRRESAPQPPPGTGTARLVHSIDDNRGVPSMSPAPSGGVGMGKMMGIDAAFKDTPEYCVASHHGRAEADSQLKEGTARLYAFGAGMTLERVDRETGLPMEWIGGCAIGPALFGRIAGHNDRIQEHIKAHGLPANSFKGWDKELFDLKGYFARRRQSEEPHRLSPGSPALKSPDGGFTVRPVNSPIVKPDGRREDRLGLVVGGPTAERPVADVFFDEGRSELVWGPKGSGFAVIRCPRSDHDRYMALDLTRGSWLRCESGDEGPVDRVRVGEPPAGHP